MPAEDLAYLTALTEELLGFAEGFIGYHSEMPVKLAAALRETAGRLRLKLADRSLNLGVVGDFSTGKSTFINALLRCPLLKEHVLQGTTKAATVIESAPSRSVSVFSHNGANFSRSFNSDEDLALFLQRLTTVPKMASLIKRVEVSLPVPFLAPGLRIIDTPGTNSLEAWHEEAAKRIIREQVDVLAVIIKATQILPQRFREFLQENFGDYLEDCVYIVTHLDGVEASQERSEVVREVRNRLIGAFGLKNPSVMPYVSPVMLEADTLSLLSRCGSCGYNGFPWQSVPASKRWALQCNLLTEETLLSQLSHRHALFYRQKLAELAERLLEAMRLYVIKRLASAAGAQAASLQRERFEIERRLTLLHNSV